MNAAERRFYDRERYKVAKAARELATGRTAAGCPVRRGDGKAYPTAIAAARDVGLKDGSHIHAACRGRQATAAGYTWRYLESWEAEAEGMKVAGKGAGEYEDGRVYRDVMASLWKGTCSQCKFYAKQSGNREICRRGAATMATNATASCPRWERVPSHVEAERARLAAYAQEQKEAAIQRNREAMERRQEREAEAEAYKWEFRSQVLGLQVDYLVGAICRRFDIGPGTGER